jgi:hypothetical protein
LDKRPEKVMLQPENIPVSYSFSNGELTAKIPGLDIYSILVIE